MVRFRRLLAKSTLALASGSFNSSDIVLGRAAFCSDTFMVAAGGVGHSSFPPSGQRGLFAQMLGIYGFIESLLLGFGYWIGIVRMKWAEWLERWGMSSLHLSAGFLKADFEPRDPDRNAAWALYVELITRITSQPLGEDEGDEETALRSVFSLFALTREVLKKEGRFGDSFAKLAIPVLNQVVRPFTAKWHRLGLQHAFSVPQQRQLFRAELARLQEQLTIYINMLADMAGVEDLHAQLSSGPVSSNAIGTADAEFSLDDW